MQKVSKNSVYQDRRLMDLSSNRTQSLGSKSVKIFEKPHNFINIEKIHHEKKKMRMRKRLTDKNYSSNNLAANTYLNQVQ